MGSALAIVVLLVIGGWLVLATTELVKNTLNLVKTGLDVVQAFEDKSVDEHWRSSQPELVASHLSDLRSYYQTLNGHWLKLVTVTNTIKTQRSAVTVSDLDLREQDLEIGRQTSALAQAQAERRRFEHAILSNFQNGEFGLVS